MPTNDINSKPSLFLKKGDYVEIVACAKFISKNDIDYAIKLLKEKGYKISLSSNIYDRKRVFAGTVSQRLEALQSALDNTQTKAIFFARGGYGTIQILEFLNFTQFQKNPKWLIGFSDVTIILTHIQIMYGIQSIHAPMLYSFNRLHTSVIERLFRLLKGQLQEIKTTPCELNKPGLIQGKVIGGNLSILYSLIGSKSFSVTKNDYILFIEDVDEYLYHLERMIYSLDHAQILKNIKGLIVGQMTNMLDNEISFGKDVNTIIYDIVKKYDYPVCFNFPIGHVDKNFPIIIGSQVELLVEKEQSSLRYI